MIVFHRVVSGNPTRRVELIAAGIFVLIWFAIDLVQFADWAWQKYNQPRTFTCEPLPGTTMCISPASIQLPGYYCGARDCSIQLTQSNAR